MCLASWGEDAIPVVSWGRERSLSQTLGFVALPGLGKSAFVGEDHGLYPVSDS